MGGEIIRLLLAAGNIDYEDKRVSFEEWPAMKPTTTFGQMPMLYWDGEELAQSMAITRFIARKAGMAGKDFRWRTSWRNVEMAGLLDLMPPMPISQSCAPSISSRSLLRCPSRTWTTMLRGARS